MLLKFKVPKYSLHKISEFAPLWGGGGGKNVTIDLHTSALELKACLGWSLKQILVVHVGSSRHSSMISTAACYRGGPRFKSQQGRVYFQVNLNVGLLVNESSQLISVFT